MRLLDHPVARRFLLEVAVGAVIGALAAAAWVYRLPDEFESTASLLMTPLPGPQVANVQLALEAAGADDWKLQALREHVVSALNEPLDTQKPPQAHFQLSAPDYALLFRADNVVAELCAFLKEKGAPMTPEACRGSIQVRTHLLAQTFNNVLYQDVIQLSVSHTDPALGSALVNFWAERCVAVAQHVREQRTASVRKFFDDAIQETRARRAERIDQVGEEGGESYTQALSLLTSLRALAGADTADLVVAAQALTPESPVGPRRTSVVLLAALFGGLLAAVLHTGLHTLFGITPAESGPVHHDVLL